MNVWCEALRACDADLMGIKCTCEGGIHRFTMYLKRIRKRNTVKQHQVVSLPPVTNCGSLDVILTPYVDVHEIIIKVCSDINGCI
jgi:hypothetical protein